LIAKRINGGIFSTHNLMSGTFIRGSDEHLIISTRIGFTLCIPWWNVPSGAVGLDRPGTDVAPPNMARSTRKAPVFPPCDGYTYDTYLLASKCQTYICTCIRIQKKLLPRNAERETKFPIHSRLDPTPTYTAGG
jgi:hypothetical protein